MIGDRSAWPLQVSGAVVMVSHHSHGSDKHQRRKVEAKENGSLSATVLVLDEIRRGNDTSSLY